MLLFAIVIFSICILNIFRARRPYVFSKFYNNLSALIPTLKTDQLSGLNSDLDGLVSESSDLQCFINGLKNIRVLLF